MATTTVREYTGAIKDTVVSFWHGLSITLSHLVRRPMTVQYPDRTPLAVRDMLPPRYRGFLEVDTAICTGCQACERACPIGCIQITLEKDAANPKQRVVTQFDIDEAKCMFCGLCVEPCPTGSIQHTREFEGSQRNIRNLVFRWADPENPFPVYKVDKNAEYYPRVPLGTLVRAKLESRRWDAPAPKFLPPEPPKPPEAKTAAAKPAAPAAKAPAPAAAAPKAAADGAAGKAAPAAAAKPDGVPAAAPAAPPATATVPSPRPSPPAGAGGEGGTLSTATVTLNSAPNPAPTAPSTATPGSERWRAAVEVIAKESPRLAAALREAVLLAATDAEIALQLPPGLHADTVERRRPEIEALLARVLGGPARLSVKVGALSAEPQPSATPASIAQAEAAERQARSSAVREAARNHPNIRDAAKILDGGIDEIEEL